MSIHFRPDVAIIPRDPDLPCPWQYVPNEISLDFLSRLSLRDVIAASLTCRNLLQLGADESIWKSLFQRRYPTSASRLSQPFHEYQGAFKMRYPFVSNLQKNRCTIREKNLGNRPISKLDVFGNLYMMACETDRNTFLIKVVHLITHQCIFRQEVMSCHARMSEDFIYLILPGEQPEVCLFNAKEGKLEKAFELVGSGHFTHKMVVVSGNRLYVYSPDLKAVNLWNLDKGIRLKTYPIDEAVLGGRFVDGENRLSLNGDYLIASVDEEEAEGDESSSDEDNANATMNVLNLVTGESCSLKDFSADIYFSTVIGNYFVVIPGKSNLKIWDLNTGECVQQVDPQEIRINGNEDPIGDTVEFGERFVTLSVTNGIKVWGFKDSSDAGSLAVLYEFTGWVCKEYKFEDRFVYIPIGDETIEILDVPTGHCTTLELGKHKIASVDDVRISEETVIVFSKDRTVSIWDLETQDCLYRFSLGENPGPADLKSEEDDHERYIAERYIALFENFLFLQFPLEEGAVIKVFDVTSGQCINTIPTSKMQEDDQLMLVGDCLVMVSKARGSIRVMDFGTAVEANLATLQEMRSFETSLAHLEERGASASKNTQILANNDVQLIKEQLTRLSGHLHFRIQQRIQSDPLYQSNRLQVLQKVSAELYVELLLRELHQEDRKQCIEILKNLGTLLNPQYLEKLCDLLMTECEIGGGRSKGELVKQHQTIRNQMGWEMWAKLHFSGSRILLEYKIQAVLKFKQYLMTS